MRAGVVRVEPSGVIRIRGRNLASVRTVVFIGNPGPADDVRRTPRRGTNTRRDVSVPLRANSGRIQLLAPGGVRSIRSRPTLEIEEAERRVGSEPEDPGDTGGTTPSDGAPSGNGSFVWPVNGPITSPFGQRWGRLHAGIDIGVRSGTSIKATEAGTVINAGWVSGYGNYTCVHHSFSAPVDGATDYVSCYAHQSKFLVSNGARVSRGQVIGLSGCTGSCYGDHLHFEIRRGDKMWATPEDPVPHLPARKSAAMAIAKVLKSGGGRPMHGFLPQH
jgi:murein DD-endopeptidase MepM/ murein hydrolase activator NlpD